MRVLLICLLHKIWMITPYQLVSCSVLKPVCTFKTYITLKQRIPTSFTTCATLWNLFSLAAHWGFIPTFMYNTKMVASPSYHLCIHNIVTALLRHFLSNNLGNVLHTKQS